MCFEEEFESRMFVVVRVLMRVILRIVSVKFCKEIREKSKVFSLREE